MNIFIPYIRIEVTYNIILSYILNTIFRKGWSLLDFFKKMGTKIVAYFKNMSKGQRVRLVVLVSTIVIVLAVAVFLPESKVILGTV